MLFCHFRRRANSAARAKLATSGETRGFSDHESGKTDRNNVHDPLDNSPVVRIDDLSCTILFAASQHADTIDRLPLSITTGAVSPLIQSRCVHRRWCADEYSSVCTLCLRTWGLNCQLEQESLKDTCGPQLTAAAKTKKSATPESPTKEQQPPRTASSVL